MTLNTQKMPLSVFKLNKTRIYNDSVQLNNDYTTQSAWCEVTGLVSFEWSHSYNASFPYLETSAGRIILPPRQWVYTFDTPYTGRLEIGTLALLPGDTDFNLYSFWNFQVLIPRPEQLQKTRPLPLHTFDVKNGELIDGGESLFLSEWGAAAVASCKVSQLVSFDLDVKGRRGVVWLQTAAGKEAIDFGKVKTDGLYTHRFDPPYTGVISVLLDAQKDPDLAGDILLLQFLCLA